MNEVLSELTARVGEDDLDVTNYDSPTCPEYMRVHWCEVAGRAPAGLLRQGMALQDLTAQDSHTGKWYRLPLACVGRVRPTCWPDPLGMERFTAKSEGAFEEWPLEPTPGMRMPKGDEAWLVKLEEVDNVEPDAVVGGTADA